MLRAQRPLPRRQHDPELVLRRGVRPAAAISLAMLNRVASVSGCSGPSIRSRIASTARSSPSAAVCSPRADISWAMLNLVVSVSGWSGPSARR